MVDQILQYDTSLFVFLNNLGSPAWDNFWLVVTYNFTFIPLYTILLYLLYRNYGIKPLVIMVIVTVLMITFTDQIANVFKRSFARPRPCGEAALVDKIRFIAVRCGKYGFFSGHAANSMAAAVFSGLLLRPYYKHLIFILLFWSAVVAYSRIYVGVHYPLDIVSGLAFGGLAGFAFYRLVKYLIKRFV